MRALSATIGVGLSLTAMAGWAACPVHVGDVGGDGETNVVDVQCVALSALAELSNPLPPQDDDASCTIGALWVDVDCSGAVTVVDVLITAVSALDPSLPGAIDADANGCPDACEALTPYEPSVARVWNEALLDAIRFDEPRPTVHARNLYHLSVAMWDVWAAYSPDAQGVLFEPDAVSEAADIEAARHEAVSHAAFRLLMHRFESSVGASTTVPALLSTMASLGYPTELAGGARDPNTPAGLGAAVAEAVVAFGLSDGANEANGYVDNSGYSPVNPPLQVAIPGTTMNDPNRWQSLALETFVTQNGIELGETPPFVGPHWGEVDAFALFKASDDPCHLDPGPPPYLGGVSDGEFKDANVEVLEYSRLLDPLSGEVLDLSPSSRGNNSLGHNDGAGHPLNPWTGQPYAKQIVLLGDFGRVVAEFWADGPDSETPPGHWNTVANDATLHPSFVRRIRGRGPELSPLEWDVKMYLVLNAALHDAAIAAWDSKAFYDYVRPISSIRYMAEKGQSSDPSLPVYSPEGLPLVEGLVELITEESAAPGERHAHLEPFIGEIAVHAWGGAPFDADTQFSGAQWIPGNEWVPYQLPTFVTPPFAGYVSGHSTFSRAAAEVLASLTGSRFFPGGLGGYTLNEADYLEFEYGPLTDVTLQWATYFDASDESGLSRIYGGIHVRADDVFGRIMGAQVAAQVLNKALPIVSGMDSAVAE